LKFLLPPEQASDLARAIEEIDEGIEASATALTRLDVETSAG